MRVVASFTTVPSRADRIGPMLESLARQTFKPDDVYLWLPRFCIKENCSYSKVESRLRHVMCFEGLSVLDCDDWGPATKLLPALSRECDPETVIVTLDDDVAYERHALEELVEASCRFPDCSLGFMGGLPGPSFLHAEQVARLGKSFVSANVLGGYRGILYRRKMFGSEVFSEMEELRRDGPFMVDDQFFGWYLHRKGFDRRIIPTKWHGSGHGNVLNFKFLNLGGGIYHGESKLADESITRLENMYREKGWKHP